MKSTTSISTRVSINMSTMTTRASTIDSVRRSLASGATDAYIDTLTAIGMDLDQTTALLTERWWAPDRQDR